jgi:carboxypeptidase Taq
MGAIGMEAKLQELKARLSEAYDLNMVNALLNWDQSTYMPSGGAPARGRQMGLVAQLAHEKMTDPAIGKLLDGLRPFEESLPYDSDDASLIRVARREYERNTKVPSAFMAKLQAHWAESYDLWTRARPANDFKMVHGALEKTLDLSRELANYFPGYEHIADPLINLADYGMKASDVRAIFTQLRDKLVPIVQDITSQDPAEDAFIHLIYPAEKQLAFGLEVVKRFGYDFNRGRQDLTHHPFMTKFSLGDVRITTRVHEDDLSGAIFSTMHESGHAIYEQGINMAYEATPLGTGTSSGAHESQSRTWENLVGRSRSFWEYFYPRLQEVFPQQLKSVKLDAFYRAINKVQRSLIRIDADEVTYNLHPIIRFDLELQLLEGKLAVRDLPEAWRARYTSDIGITPHDDKDGVLQDVHWFAGFIGGSFQGYTLGNIMGAQFFAQALKQHPEIPNQIEHGDFDTLRNWLTQNIYQYGSKFTAGELIQRVTGGPLSVDPYIQYLKTKYGELYRLS